jgi:hypothetical protein
VELDEGSVDAVEHRLEPEPAQVDTRRGVGLLVADGVGFRLQRGPDEGRRRPFVGVESPEFGPLEPGRHVVQQYEVDPDVLPDAVREEERGSDTPAQDVQPSGLARERVQREVRVCGGLVTEEHELAHTTRMRSDY